MDGGSPAWLIVGNIWRLMRQSGREFTGVDVPHGCRGLLIVVGAWGDGRFFFPPESTS